MAAVQIVSIVGVASVTDVMGNVLRAMIVIVLVVSGCQRHLPPFQPVIVYEPTQRYFSTLPSVFPTLSRRESTMDWGREYQIGRFFAKDFDFYRAITAYKRAQILLKLESTLPEQHARLQEIDYHILLCYYLGGQMQETVEWFENSHLTQAGPAFPAFEDLLILLYDAYMRDGRTSRAEAIHTLIERGSSETAEALSLSQLLQEGKLTALETIYQDMCAAARPEDEAFTQFFSQYLAQAKSTSKAQCLNALLPGAGYTYVGLYRTGWTSLCLNALFGWATYQFFKRGDTAAALITLSFETGWYFGGIYGSGLAAKQYNERLYEEGARELLLQKRLFPALMLEYAF